MDAFETIRNSAAALHSQLVAAGADPDKPMDLVKAAAKQLDLELAWLPEGDPALKSARALFDEQGGVICCVDKGTPGDRACLVAHEIGHVCLHARSSACTSDDIDPSRSMEAVPVGLQRVEDYGVRERRELQANVFAREFLLPRSAARAKHLAGNGASSIADTLGLPKDIVRQQLLDALLLPPLPLDDAQSEGRPARDDPSQDRAARHRGSAFQLQAGPGTGKTRTLIKRVLSLLRDGVDPASILVLTFSNRAAGELSERMTAVMPEQAARLWIGTFHAFGLDLIRRYHDKLDLPPDPALFDRSDAIEVLEEVLPTLPLVHYRNLWDPALVLRDIVAAIGRAKDELVDDSQYLALAVAMRDRATDPDSKEIAAKALEVAQVYKIYHETLRTRRSVDFGDLIMRPTLLMETDETVRTTIRLRHRHVLVDEYQDVNRASAGLLRAVAGDGKRLWVVGDARQSIYRFRGASSINMVRFAEEYEGAAVDRLSVNYRSSEEIIRAFTAVAPHMAASQGMLPLALEADKGSSRIRPELRRFETIEDEAAGIAASVRELETSGIRLRDQAVLCRTNARLNDIAVALEVRGIPVLHLGSLFERDEVRDLLALLTLAIDPFGDGLARVGAMPRYDVPLQDIHVAIRLLRALPGPAARKLRDLIGDAGLSSEGREGLTRLAADLEGIPSSASPWDMLLTYLLDRTNLLAQLAQKESVRDRMRAVATWQFLNFVRDRSPVGSGAPIQRVLDRVRQLVLLAEERDLRQIPAGALHMDAVRLMTVHGSKGLEFEAVHIPGLTKASFPSSYRGQRCPPPTGMVEDEAGEADAAAKEHSMEEECLFFVALSRARMHLRFYHCRKQPNGNNRTPSPYLDWFAGNEVAEIAAPAAMPLPADAPRPVPIAIVWAEDWSVTDSRLRNYEQCPRRFFYTHVLGLGSARKTTAFSQTHDCLYELIQWLAAARIEGAPGQSEAAQEFERLWAAKGPVTHGFAGDYRRLADRLVTALVNTGAGRRFRSSERLAIDLAAGRVVVEPNEMTELPNGTVILRRIRTGYRRDKEYDELEYTLYHLAGRAHYGASYSVEALHLTDEVCEPAAVSPAKMKNRQIKAEAMLVAIAAGSFPADPDAVRCPRCPHFFVCDAVGRGPLSLL
jgi:DNA helicase II / ATP-dependent DNA helicase PcrA